MRNISKYYVPALLVGLLLVIGVSVNYHYQQTEETATYYDQVLERAYQDLVAGEDIKVDQASDESTTIKVFDQENELIDWVILSPDELPDQDFASLLLQSSLMAEYNNSYIYQVKD